MNFEMACEMVEAEGIKTKKVIVADDIASASEAEKEKRRGIAGMIFVFKVAGAIAETGASLDDVFKTATEVNNNIRTLGVAVSPCILPEAGKPTFEISDDEIEIGMGIHGEPGIKREKLRPANDLVDDLYKRIIDDSKLTAEDNIAVMINSLGATPLGGPSSPAWATVINSFSNAFLNKFLNFLGGLPVSDESNPTPNILSLWTRA